MASKQYKIAFGYCLYHFELTITTIINVIAQFFMIHEKWSVCGESINLEDYGEYCEWSDISDDESKCMVFSQHQSIFGRVLFEPRYCYELSKLQWEIEYAIPRASSEPLFIGFSNDMTYASSSPIVNMARVGGSMNSMFMGYGISFYKRKDYNPWCLELDTTDKNCSDLIYNAKNSWNDGLDIDDNVFGIIKFTVIMLKNCMTTEIDIYPHPLTSNKLFSMISDVKNKMMAFNCFDDDYGPCFLACSIPNGVSLKVNCFYSSFDFHYRDEM